jgi:hypothetical protein
MEVATNTLDRRQRHIAARPQPRDELAVVHREAPKCRRGHFSDREESLDFGEKFSLNAHEGRR